MAELIKQQTTFAVRDLHLRGVLFSDNPHEIAAHLLSLSEDGLSSVSIDVRGGALWLGCDWIDMYNEFKPWLMDTPREEAPNNPALYTEPLL